MSGAVELYGSMGRSSFTLDRRGFNWREKIGIEPTNPLAKTNWF